MTEEPTGDEAAAAPGPLQRLSLRTKALIIANEYTDRQMAPNELRGVLLALAPSPKEQEEVASAVEEELRAARYPAGEILSLMGELLPEEPAAAGGLAPPKAVPVPSDAERGTGTISERPEMEPVLKAANPSVIVTRKVRSPHLMPFERFEFEATPGGAPAGPSAGSAEALSSGSREAEQAGPAPPTQEMPVAGAEARAAEFRFVEGGESDTPAAPETAAALAAASGKPVVLVADDDPRARVIYRVKLEEAGFTVVEAKDGVEAWERIKGGSVHGIVMDMKMPGYHGLEVLSRMVDSGLALPVVVVSAFDQLANEFIVTTYPKLTFLTKPASPDEVTTAVMELLYPGEQRR